MKKKLSGAMSLAMILAMAVHSLALAAVQPAYVSFTTDAPCAVTVLVTAYTNPSNQSGQSASGSTSWTLDTYPSTSVTFFYPAFVVCSGVTYNFISVSPGSPLTSGDSDSTTTVTGHYVMDTTPPTLHLPADMTVEATGASGAVVTFTATADDTNPAHPAVSCVPASGTTFGLGTTTVNCSATDAAGNTANGSFTVTVQDTTPPALNLPADVTVTAADASGAVVNFSASANDLVDGSVPVTCLPASGSTFPIGSTTVNCLAADSHGNMASGSFAVTVIEEAVDTTPPVWTVPADFSVEATGPSGAVVTYTAFATDPDDAVASQSCSPASGATFPLGTTPVNCTAADTHGNTGVASFNVTVVDTTPPALTLPANITVNATSDLGAVVNFMASANDLVDGPVAVTCLPSSGSLFPIGMTTVNCSAMDSRGNTASGSFTVTVEYASTSTSTCGGGIPNRQILQPINADGSSVFKQGSTVPARFRVCGADGVSIGDPDLITSFRLVQIVSKGVVSNVDQAVLSTMPDTSFRFGNRQWLFNISTKNLTAGNTYVYLITLNDGSFIQFQFSLK